MQATPKHDLLKRLPGVDILIEKCRADKQFETIPESVLKKSIRMVLERFRKRIIDGDIIDLNQNQILSNILDYALKVTEPKLVPLINATGVVLHTNLGRSLLCEDALLNITRIAQGYSNLEFNIETGKRGLRYAVVEDLICELTGAEAAMAVNNNAGAVLLCLDTLAKTKEAIVSRGELVEIGGSFRIPDVMARSGAILKEVGATNRTHPRDYENAISENTGILLKVHTSNYKIEGFTTSVSLKELVEIGRARNILVMEDLGSGTLIDLSRYGLAREPTVSEAVSAGADCITFSGDKLLGGPQAGIIVGKKSVIRQIRSNPMTRALRIDKLTLAALESTLSLYRDEATAILKIPTLRMLTESFDSIAERSMSLLNKIREIIGKEAEVEPADLSSRTGGGAYPSLALPSRCITILPSRFSSAQLEKRLRLNRPSIIGRVEDDRFIIDPRTLQPGDENPLLNALSEIFKKVEP